jgi:hypothetical protein
VELSSTTSLQQVSKGQCGPPHEFQLISKFMQQSMHATCRSFLICATKQLGYIMAATACCTLNRWLYPNLYA